MRNNLNEFSEDGTYRSKSFKPKRYLGEYLSHLVGLAEVEKNKKYGDLFSKTMNKWAKGLLYAQIPCDNIYFILL